MYVKKGLFALIVLAVVYTFLTNTSHGIEINPSKELIEEAIKYGEAHPEGIFKTERLALASFGNWPDYGGGIIMSKLIRCTVISSMKARAKKEFTKEETDETIGLKHLIIDYKGGAGVYKIMLKQGGKEIGPSEMKKPDFEQVGPSKHAALYVVKFPYSKLDPNAKTTILVIKDFGTKEYTVDFSKIK